MQKLGFNISDKPTSFQDLSFNINLPTNKFGTFSIFASTKQIIETDHASDF
jgi:hypothetical protein